MLEIKNLTIEVFTKPLVENLNLFLKDGDKVAVIGEEGNGKSTLLKTIFDREEVEKYSKISGEIFKKNLRISYLEQSLDPKWDNCNVYEYFFKEGGDITGEIFKILGNLKIPSEILESKQKINTLSGGEKVKIQIVKILLQNPDIFLLDEPTNDLDIETLQWLENFIQHLKQPVMYVSHDETLLENTANTILHMENLKKQNTVKQTIKKVDYKTYVEEREKEIQKQEQMAKLEEREHKKDKKIFSRRKSIVRSKQINIKDSTERRILNKRMKNILIHEKRLAKKKQTQRPETEEPIFFTFDSEINIPKNKIVLNMNMKELKIKQKVLAKNIKLKISGPEKIAIIGDNGIGKTVLLKKIKEELEKKKDFNIGYMPQNYEEVLDLETKPLDYLLKNSEKIEEDIITTYMGSMRFNWDEMNGRIKELSYGQKAKLIILKMMIDEKNVLLLDEPTRNLSATSNPVIRKILKSFTGSIISISHDRKFLKEVCDCIYKLEKTKIRKFNQI